ncbi:MAG: Asp-tRNA(Asn)/Glu-tRNA(Gln) amidotransferase subunit GatA [Patescibacteria group bacterium]|nr:Asp-tRNA(Asn)/Glu-tRNA(Gln) amidotransferase subunit GatA [Patescibacteria group bacterium]MDD4304549.1 Asp-tRNA(Asn)/Glu-tRNA(Gln) amidotransferase subunit GatA [Patescibacteria group bacterium]MDD4695657.1 Asp-tRNA(Asn)/Glu-tRNA(Gln) amidotransferase subunit GatA [Patescibacteria group bacterium]
MENFTIEKLRKAYKDKQILCSEFVRRCFVNIKNDKLNDFITLFEDDAISQAKKIDKKIVGGILLKNLEGIPIAIKDNILIEGKKTTSASKMLENYIAPYDATVIKKLKESGVIILGKTNMDEFAMGASNETSYFGSVLNPCDNTLVPGGSSGGSAAAVASNHSIFALGSDTGGSIRQPAAFCGVVGFKPSYGSVSRYGLMSLASSLDQIGPLANSVEDVVAISNIIFGKDEKDMTSVDRKNINIKNIKKGIKKKVIGYPKKYHELSIDQDIKNSFEDVLEKLKRDGITLKEIDLSFMDEALAVYYIIQPAEASTNLARFDGLRYGFNVKNSKDLLDNYLKNRTNGFGDEVKRRIIMGTYVLSQGYRDAYYNMAKSIEKDIQLRFDKIFKEIDCLILPTTPSKAFKLNEKIEDPLTMYLADIFTVSANIAGLPAISIPIVKDPLPIGLQIMGGFMKDETVLNFAWNIEKMIENYKLAKN